MRDISFGQYYPTNSPIHRLDPRAKMIFTMLFLVFIFFVQSYLVYLAIFVFLMATTMIAKIPVGSVFKSIKAVLFLIVFTAILNLFLYSDGEPLVQWWIFKITAKGIDFTIKMALRLMFLVMGTAILTLTTTPMELTDGIESLLKPLKYIKVPVHDIAIIMSIALRFIPGLLEETDKIVMAQKARGGSFDTGKLHERAKAVLPILIPLFVSAFRRADELADALDARCYNASPKRTKMKVLHFSYRDIIALFVIAILITFIMLDKFYFHGLDYMLFNWIKGMI